MAEERIEGTNPPQDIPTIVAPVSSPRIPDHELLRQIGAGAYGEVWLAKSVLGSFRAVKIIHRKTFPSDTSFEREFQGIHKFEPISREHPGLVDILQAGRNDDQGFYYYVMELADDQVTGTQIHPDRYLARTLSREKSNRGRLPFEECLKIGISLAEALDHMHKANLVHRDIKPANVIFVNALPKLADVGLVTGIGQISLQGTPGFIPPEGPGNPPADVYSLGKVLYEISTGKEATSFPELPTEVGGLPDHQQLLGLNEVILKACDNDVRRRFQTAHEMLDALKSLQAGKKMRYDGASLWPSVSWSLAGKTLAVLVLLAVFMVGGYSLFRNRATSTPPLSTGKLLFEDDFSSKELKKPLWTWNHFESSYQGTGRREHKVTQQEGILLIESTAEHEGGWTSIQDVWLESIMDFKGKGDVAIDIEFDGEARNGTLAVKVSDGSIPKAREDPTAINLYITKGGNLDPLSLGTRRIHIEVSDSSRMATVFTKEEPVAGFRTVDLSPLAHWKLRLYTGCSTSAGFRPGKASMRLYNVRATTLSQQTSIMGLVTDTITRRPVPGAAIRRSDGTKLAESGLDGSYGATLLPGMTSLIVDARDYAQSKPITVEVVKGERKLLNVPLRRTRFGLGDVVSCFSYGTNQVNAIAATSNAIYYATSDDAGTNRFFRASTEGTETVSVAEGHGLWSLVFCGDKLFGAGAWPGTIFSITEKGQELFKLLKTDRPGDTINWPHDMAFDGKRLWFVENTSIENRYGLYALDLDTKEIVAHLPAQDKQISGLAWDGKSFWVSSLSGRVYEVNPSMAMSEGSVEAGTGREFKGHYTRLTYADGFLWGLDDEVRRICKIKIDQR